MLTSIELDNQPTFHTAKVSNETSDRMLAAKFRAAYLPRPQSRPESAFGIGLVAAESAGSVFQCGRIGLHSVTLTLTLSQGERE